MKRRGDGNERLFVYGSLAPRKRNFHQLKRLRGSWERAQVNARLLVIHSGLDARYLGLQDGKKTVQGHLFVSRHLPDHWKALERFEGVHYERGTITVCSKQGVCEACVFFIKPNRVKTAWLGRRALSP